MSEPDTDEPVEFPNYRVVITDGERQTILFALAELKRAQPGWTAQVAGIEAKLGGQIQWPEESAAYREDLNDGCG